MALLPVADALARITADVKPLAAEPVKLADAMGRVLASPVKAVRDQPPFAASAMDGYAVRAADLAALPVRLKVAGVAAAGHAYAGTLRPGQAVRIFTGAPLPRGADTVVIQENTETPEAGAVSILEAGPLGQHVRERGLDFRRGEELLPAGLALNARDIGLAAAANAATVRVRRKPLVALFATGDELVEPGGKPGRDQIVSSNSQTLMLLARRFGADHLNLGIVRDDLRATTRAIARAAPADILLTTGGASVGDHDFVREALLASGVKLDFWKIAMRPGKPFMFGRKGRLRVMGLPGNPVSALVCARLFLVPLLRSLQGLPAAEAQHFGRLAVPMRANDLRQDYVRGTMTVAEDGARSVRPFPRQDSSMLRTFREAECLIVRPPHAPEAPAGALVQVVPLDF